MRRSATLLAMLLTTLIPAAETPLPRLEAITPDGDLADWGEGGARVPFMISDATRLPDPTRSAASARFAWDDQGLLIAVEVTDATPSEAHQASAAYTADSVELFLTADPGSWSAFQLVLSPGRDPAHPTPRSYVFASSEATSRLAAGEPRWAIRPRGEGYIAEARLPWTVLAITPAVGRTIGTRLYVNDRDDTGTRSRFTWQPPAGGRPFHAFTLAAGGAVPALDAPVGWTALDVAENGGRLNVVASAAMAGTTWQVRQGERTLGEVRLAPVGAAAAGTMILPSGRVAGPLTLTGPDQATLTVRDDSPGEAAGVIARAGSPRASAGDRTLLAFARTEFPHYLFVEPRFPSLGFLDPARVERLLGSAPTIVTRWLDADGKDVTAPAVPGRYAARSEITVPGRADPIVLEHILYRMPAGTGLPWTTDEVTARLYAFDLQGGDATPTQSARVAERWWHGVRRARGWSQALPFEIHVPAGEATTPRPLIVHLHGSGQHSDVAVKELMPVLTALAGPEAILVYPRSQGFWRGPAVGELIDTLMQRYPIDPARISLIGFSLGGIGCWEVALDQPERFAAVVPIGPRMGSPADAPRLKDVAIWAFNGEDDPTTTAPEAALMVDAIRRAGGQAKLTLLPGKSHGDSQGAAYHHPGLFAWMLAQRRGSPSAAP